MDTMTIRETSQDLTCLLHSAQYVIGPRPFRIDETWKAHKIRNNLFLTAHPNLPVMEHHHETTCVFLLGYMLDPENPEFNDRDILDSLLQKSSNQDELIANSSGLGGRWLLIASDDNECRVIPDAAGLKQLFYTNHQYADDMWCFSQPNLAKIVLSYEMDPQAVDFINHFRSINDEYWWPGESSAFKEIKALMPNHYLSMELGRSIRFWPNTDLPKIPLRKAVNKVKHTFGAMMESAANRFDLAVGISSGLDSRLLMASCKSISDKVVFYSVIAGDRTEDHPDIAIPCRLAERLGLNHHLIDQRNISVQPDFEKVFCSQVPFAHSIRIHGQQKHLNFFGRRKVAVTGNVSEVGRCRIGSPKSRLNGKLDDPLTGRKVSSLLELCEHPFADNALNDWLSDREKFFNYNILDLLHWEHKCGRWFSNNCTEFDIAWKDYLSPYNNRYILTDMLSVDERYRVPPRDKFYNCLIKAFWPETLSEPVNPHQYKRRGLRSRIKSTVKALIQ